MGGSLVRLARNFETSPRADGARASAVSSYSMAQEPPSDSFRCRICAATTYERVVVMRESGQPYLTKFFACMGCSVMFGDPLRFSEPVPGAKARRVDAPISFRRSQGATRFRR